MAARVLKDKRVRLRRLLFIFGMINFRLAYNPRGQDEYLAPLGNMCLI